MKIQEIRGFTEDELVAKAGDFREELFKLRFQHGIRPLENTARLQELKKNIARIETVRSEKRLAK